MKNRVIQAAIILILSFVIVLSISLLISMLQDELIQDDKLQYENKLSYPLGVKPTEYDEEFEEDYDLYSEDYNE